MKKIIFDILTDISEHPGSTIYQVGIRLSGSWSRVYVKDKVYELMYSGQLESEKTGKGHSLRITDTGAELLKTHQDMVRGEAE